MKNLLGIKDKRRMNAGEPQPEIAAPSCPKHLTAAARAEWRRIVPMLLELGLLAKIDRVMLAAYCTAWGRFVEAEEKLASEGAVVKTKNGTQIQSPWLAISNRAAKDLKAFAEQFGLSPASRTRVHTLPGNEGQSKWNKFFKPGDQYFPPSVGVSPRRRA